MGRLILLLACILFVVMVFAAAIVGNTEATHIATTAAFVALVWLML